MLNTLIQYIVNPKHIHLIGAKHVMRYLKGTLDYGLRYTSSGEIKFHVYVYLYCGGSTKDRKNTSVWKLNPVLEQLHMQNYSQKRLNNGAEH